MKNIILILGLIFAIVITNEAPALLFGKAPWQETSEIRMIILER